MLCSTTLRRTVLHVTAMGGACLGAVSSCQACSSEPLLASVCVMAIPWTNLQGFMPAVGTSMPVNSNQALFSLLGTTFGGDGRTNFLLPDLRGRVIVGAGQPPGQPNFAVGVAGGNYSITLQPANVPVAPHVHALGASGRTTVTLGNLAATTTTTGLTATTTLASVTASANASSLTLKGYSGNAGSASASGGALATPQGPTNRIYASSTPDVSMAAGSISGNAPVTFTGNPATTVSGNLTTTLSGLPTVALSGTTEVASQSAATPLNAMPPYLPMNVFIAVQGVYPNRN